MDIRKLYLSLTDGEAARLGLIRVIDESGEDYLYPKKLFAAIALPPAVRRRLAR